MTIDPADPKTAPQQIDALAGRLADEHGRLVDYMRTATVLLGLIPFVYGVLTWSFGINLWSGSVVYQTALGIPGAPQSWGTLFLILGAGVIVASFRGRNKLIGAFALATALILSVFMVTFLAVAIRQGEETALPPSVVYGVLSLLFLNRAHLAWLSVPRRQDG
jgi:hypothetical protein